MNKNEILAIMPDAESVSTIYLFQLDCVICLYNLFNGENIKNFSEDFMVPGVDSVFKKKLSYAVKVVQVSICDFHEYNINLDKKPYMGTPCRHFFHTPCLENWFKQKKECPSCRQDIEEAAQ